MTQAASPSQIPKTHPWLSMGIAALVPAAYAAGFLVMAAIRAGQGREGAAYPSQIQALAVHNDPHRADAEARDRGRVVFEHYCQICHGEEGKGDGFNASRLVGDFGVSPCDLGDAAFWARTDVALAMRVIDKGGPSIGKSRLMPAWGMTLNERQRRDVIEFVQAWAMPGGWPKTR